MGFLQSLIFLTGQYFIGENTSQATHRWRKRIQFYLKYCQGDAINVYSGLCNRVVSYRSVRKKLNILYIYGRFT